MREITDTHAAIAEGVANAINNEYHKNFTATLDRWHHYGNPYPLLRIYYDCLMGYCIGEFYFHDTHIEIVIKPDPLVTGDTELHNIPYDNPQLIELVYAAIETLRKIDSYKLK